MKETAKSPKKLSSPIGGVVLRRRLRVGAMISQAQDMPILSIGDTSVLRVRAEVDWVRADAFADTRFPGQVVHIGSMVGRKQILTEQPAEKLDNKVLEVLIELDDHPPLPVGLRVDAFITPQDGAPLSSR